jgi:hypothetical protein
VTISPDALEAELLHLNAADLDSLGAILRARARLRRVPLTEDEARAAINNAPPTRHGVPFVGGVRGGTRILVERGYHPEQITDAMTKVAMDLGVHPLVAVEAVKMGCLDGMAEREGAA